MKLKNWVSLLLLIITGIALLLLFADNIAINIGSLVVALINVTLLTKYSKLCDR